MKYGNSFTVNRLYSGDIENIAKNKQREILETVFAELDENRWVSMMKTVEKQEDCDGNLNYRIMFDVVPSKIERVYVPIYEQENMPKDVYKCSYCKGYTKNDERGNCAACGAPRWFGE